MSRDPAAPPSGPLDEPAPGRYELAGRGRRLINFIIDGAASALLAILLAALIAAVTRRSLHTLLDVDSFNQLTFSLAAETLYYISCESLTGRTLGKLVTGTRTVTVTGQKLAFERVVLRTLVRFLPFEFLSFLGGQPIGWHDRWTGTRVVRA